MKRIFVQIFCFILACQSAGASEFRFSSRPNKADLVQWRAWGPEMLEEARKKDRLILLSLSAVWCHWCHVMDETTYSDRTVIDFINEHFIPVRVDADMRPDIDSLYNQGGWPSTAILTPQGEVISGGNYLPPEEMLARLKRAAALYASDKEGIARRIEQAGMMRSLRQGGMPSSPDKGDIENIITILKDSFDEKEGGFGSGQKFPNPDALDFLLSRYVKSRDKGLQKIITRTLGNMAKGDIYDRVEGGFFRYATKPDWSVPHYEKMLEVNAGILKNYAEAYLVFKEEEYLHILKKTIHYVRNNLLDKTSGVFFGSQDADESYYEKTDRKGLTVPAVDRTAYVDSSALMISALVAAYDATGNRQYLDMAAEDGTFILDKVYSGQEGVFHYYRGGTPYLKGMLADNALFGLALLDLYNATGEGRYLIAAQKTGDLLIDRFYDPGGKQFRSSLEADFVKPVTAGMLSEVNSDLANYRALHLLGRLEYLGENKKLKKVRDDVLATFAGEYARFTPYAAAYGNALLWAVSDPVEITIVTDGSKINDILAAVRNRYIPEKVLRVLSITSDQEEIKRLRYPLKKAVYLCAGKRCSKPITRPEQLKTTLRQFMKKPIELQDGQR
jgi:uncharacterized protein YyaL (SSP411 family)